MTRRARASIVVGAVVTVLLLAVLVPFSLAQSAPWTARSSMLLVPNLPAGTDPDRIASVYESLNDGQVAATYAEVIRNSGVVETAVTGMALTPEQEEDLRVTVEVVPDTTIIQVTAVSADRDVAVEAVGAVATGGIDAVNALGQIYRAQAVGVDASAVTPTQSPLTPPVYVGISVVGALVAGLVAQQLVLRAGVVLAGLRGGSRSREEAAPSAAPAVAEPAVAREQQGSPAAGMRPGDRPASA